VLCLFQPGFQVSGDFNLLFIFFPPSFLYLLYLFETLTSDVMSSLIMSLSALASPRIL
jgi:hypothetical protein